MAPLGLHNALSDAIWNKETSEYLDRVGKPHRAVQVLPEAKKALQDSFERGSRD